MKSVLLIAGACVAGYHGVMLVLCCILGKLLLFSKFGLLRLIMQPNKTINMGTGGLKRITHHFVWALIGCFSILIALT